MQLVYKKNIVELIHAALAEAKRVGREAEIEAIEVDKVEAEELHRLVFRFHALRPSFLRHESDTVKAFITDLGNPKSKVLYMGIPVRLKVNK